MTVVADLREGRGKFPGDFGLLGADVLRLAGVFEEVVELVPFAALGGFGASVSLDGSCQLKGTDHGICSCAV